MRAEPHARLGLHVLNQPVERGRARAMPDDVRVHRQDEHATFIVGRIELRLERLQDEIG